MLSTSASSRCEIFSCYLQELDATRFESLEDGNESGHAQKIVRELYQRYEKQLQRWRDYRKLFSFLFFVAWYLATLYMQRSANTAYMVHSTLSDVLNPGVTVMKTQDEVYIWLTKTLKVSIGCSKNCQD